MNRPIYILIVHDKLVKKIPKSAVVSYINYCVFGLFRKVGVSVTYFLKPSYCYSQAVGIISKIYYTDPII